MFPKDAIAIEQAHEAVGGRGRVLYRPATIPKTWAIQGKRRVLSAQVGAEQSAATEHRLGRRGSYEATSRGTSTDDGARQLQCDDGTTLSSIARLDFATMCSHYRLHYGKPEASSPSGPRAP